MADKKITELTNITGANLVDADEFVVVDISADETKAITLGELKEAFDSGSGFVRITGDTMTGPLDVQSTITSDGLTVDGTILATGASATLSVDPRDGTGNTWSWYNPTGDGLFAYGNSADRMLIASNGDISFYEDTGITPKFFWDASAESLGIGTSSPSAKLDVVSSGATAETIAYFGNANITDGLSIETNGNLEWGFNAKNSRSLTFSTNQTERMRIDSSGNVGIGTSTITSSAGWTPKLVLSDSTSPAMVIKGANSQQVSIGSSNGLYLDSFGSTTGSNNRIVFRVASGNSSFTASEAMRIDSSGNLLVGKTVTTFNTKGMQIDGTNGNFSITASGATTAFFNRTSTDGNIAQFYKDGTTVGSIGSVGGANLAIGTGDTGIRFVDSNDQIYPYNMSTNANRDASIDIGTSGARFKDLYLSGGVYLGGTGSANKLDDYEEGSWTPVVTSASGTLTTVTISEALYTKIGRFVTVHTKFVLTDAGTGSASLTVDGFPYVINSDYSNGVVMGRNVAGGDLMFGQLSGGNSTATFLRNYDGTDPIVNGHTYTITATYGV